MAQKSWLYLNHRPQGQMHYLILNSKICEVAHSAHSNSPQPTFPSCHGSDMNPSSPWRREEEVGGLGSLLPTIDSPSEHTCFTDVNIYLIVHPNTWITWWQLEPGVPTEYLVANWTELSAVFREASWTNRQIFFSFKNQDYWGKKKNQARQRTHPKGLVPALLLGVFVVPFSSSDDGVTWAMFRAHWSLHSRCVCLCAW